MLRMGKYKNADEFLGSANPSVSNISIGQSFLLTGWRERMKEPNLRTFPWETISIYLIEQRYFWFLCHRLRMRTDVMDNEHFWGRQERRAGVSCWAPSHFPSWPLQHPFVSWAQFCLIQVVIYWWAEMKFPLVWHPSFWQRAAPLVLPAERVWCHPELGLWSGTPPLCPCITFGCYLCKVVFCTNEKHFLWNTYSSMF